MLAPRPNSLEFRLNTGEVVENNERCPYCHDDIHAGEPCTTCNAHYHPECKDDLTETYNNKCVSCYATFDTPSTTTFAESRREIDRIPTTDQPTHAIPRHSLADLLLAFNQNGQGRWYGRMFNTSTLSIPTGIFCGIGFSFTPEHPFLDFGQSLASMYTAMLVPMVLACVNTAYQGLPLRGRDALSEYGKLLFGASLPFTYTIYKTIERVISS